MSIIHPEVIQELVNEWHERVSADEKETLKKLMHIDGKTVKGNKRSNQKPAHIVSAYNSVAYFTQCKFIV